MVKRRTDFLIWLWTGFVLFVVYLPIACCALASFSKSRYFGFPVTAYSTSWWGKMFASIEITMIVRTSIAVALLVTLFSVVIATFGALAFARYDWKGRRLFQKLILLPIFFPQPVLGLALLLGFSAAGIQTTWMTAVFAHLVWIVPVVTLVIAIQVYGFDPSLEEAAFDLGCTRLQVLREVTLPLLWPGIWSGMLFAFLLSWSNFPLSLYTTGADSTVPEWLYSKMVAGYTPMVPALGTMATLSAAAILLLGGLVAMLARKRQVA